ncbi:MAG TPA: DUF1028 domain-containing protein [Actinomycetota bacterium]|nr:DUF1028 domain-containing protein [Actinomycetota bacterium]
MTFSIVATSSEEWGVAVASKFPAVGVIVPWARAGAGAVATQSYANTSFGPKGLDLMAEGIPARETLGQLLEDDDGREQRQVGLVDATGTVATFTGSECMPWAGGRTGQGYACQGNILTGQAVIDGMAAAFEGSEGDLVDRLLAALAAGDRAGGDRRGRQSAALVVVRDRGGYGGYTDRYVDLRVDDHPQAPAELARLFETYDREILIRDDPILDSTTELITELQRRLKALGRYAGEITGTYDEVTRRSIEDFAGEVNLEGKTREDDRLYESVVREIRDITPDVL